MSGAEHYRTAEVLLTNIRREVGGDNGTPLFTPEHQHRLLLEAQVHATLALTAATIDAQDGTNSALYWWHEVIA